MTRRRDDEGGAVLVLALLIVTVVALVVGTVLTQGDGSLRATLAVREVAATTYAADGAAQVALNDLRTGYGFETNPNEPAFNNNLDGAGCFGKDQAGNPIGTLFLPGFYPAAGRQGGPTSAAVECGPEDGTGAQGSDVPINSHNKPGYAIVTLNGPLTTADDLKVHGGVYSNSTITGKVSLDAGDAWAFGACAQTSVTPPATKHCNSGQKIADPNYANDLGGAVPALQVPPTSCTSGVAVFTPGYYDDARALNTATNLCSVAWFPPGTYYLDFHNDSCANVCPSGLFGSGSVASNVWRINGATVVGGTPIDADGNTLNRPPPNPSMPGACRSPITDKTAQGVQFVFGGNSQIYVDQNSHVELCGTYHADRPPIEIYGLKSGSTPTSSSLSSSGSAVTTTGGTFTNATPGSLAAADGNVASWTTSSANAQSATVTSQGFAPGSPVPPGSVLTAATLRITHKDADTSNNSQGSAVLTIGATSTGSYPLPAQTTSTTYAVPLSATDLNKLAAEVHAHGYAGARVDYTAKMKAKATATLDAITIDLTYYLPVLRGQAGTCVDGTVGNCKFISMKNGNNKILFYLQGTTYVPYADVDILLGNFSAEVAKFGIVARQLEFAITNGNPDWTGPIFEIPDDSPGFGTGSSIVQLKVHVCPAQPTCDTSAPVALTVRAQLWDENGWPEPPDREVSVLSWSAQR
jgi:hypothetical protein